MPLDKLEAASPNRWSPSVQTVMTGGQWTKGRGKRRQPLREHATERISRTDDVVRAKISIPAADECCKLKDGISKCQSWTQAGRKCSKCMYRENRPGKLLKRKELSVAGDSPAIKGSGSLTSRNNAAPPAAEETWGFRVALHLGIEPKVLYNRKDDIAELMIAAFSDWLRNRITSCPARPGNGTSDAGGGGVLLPPSRSAGGKRSLKRPPDDDNDDDDGDNPHRSIHSSKRGRSSSDHTCWLACPFYKHDPLRHMSCMFRNRLTSTSYVKQHLARDHAQPLYCPTCGEIFALRETLNEHIRARLCQSIPFSIEGIPDDQMRVIRQPVGRSVNERERWYRMWDILFPQTPRPQSPYVSDERTEFSIFFRSRGQGQLSYYLANTANLHDAFGNPISADLANYLERDILNLLFGPAPPPPRLDRHPMQLDQQSSVGLGTQTSSHAIMLQDDGISDFVAIPDVTALSPPQRPFSSTEQGDSVHQSIISPLELNLLPVEQVIDSFFMVPDLPTENNNSAARQRGARWPPGRPQ